MSLSKPIRVLSVFGTRPEAIKMCPLIKVMAASEQVRSIVCLTGQHREMLDQVIDIFGTPIDYHLDIMRPSQTLTTITTDILDKMGLVLAESRPDVVLVHGDTTTSFAAALAAFYQKIPVGHVEAGLRTYNRYSPYPEEMNRTLTGRLATYHFAPTRQNAENLAREGIRENVYITGNTVIDAFQTTVRQGYRYKNETLRGLRLDQGRTILMTAHRRENLGQPLENICRAVRRIAADFPDTRVIYPVHLNPAVRKTVYSLLDGQERVYLLEPLDVEDMHNLMAASYLVLTDSGGLQEEAPSCGVPVLVLRTETERPEAVEAGTVKVAGVNEEDIYDSTKELLLNKEAYHAMAHAVNPYGDGHASERIVRHLVEAWAMQANHE